MVVFPLVMDSVNFASLWVLYRFQSEKSVSIAFLTLGSNLLTGKEGTTLLPPTGISSFWATNFYFLSVVW